MKNQEVIKHAFALAGNMEGLLEFVYTLLSEFILKQTEISKQMLDSHAFFLKSIMEEVPGGISIDPLHNKYINYITQGDIKIFIPSKLYMFGPAACMQGRINYVKGNSPTPGAMLQAECVMQLGSRHKGHVEYATDVLKTMQHIKETTGQQISIAHLDWKNVFLENEVHILQLARQTLKISRNLTSICMWACKVPQSVYERIVSQLQHCSNLKRLDLSNCQSMDISKAIAASKSLSDVYLYDSELSQEAYRSISMELQKHNFVQRLHLNRTKGIPAEMANAIKGMKSLQVFRANGCETNQAVAEPLLKALADCCHMEEIQLGMNTLTGCVPYLFPTQTHVGFPSLKRLWIKGTYLNKHDVIALRDALHTNRLPQLQQLDLSMNYEVAGTLSVLFNGTGHPGFPFLIKLDLLKIQLTGEDLISIAESVRQGRMPKLRRLTLDKNNLSAVKDQVKILVQICVNSYKKLQVLIQVFDTNLSEAFVRELQSLCEDSVVLVKNVRPQVRI